MTGQCKFGAKCSKLHPSVAVSAQPQPTMALVLPWGLATQPVEVVPGPVPLLPPPQPAATPALPPAPVDVRVGAPLITVGPPGLGTPASWSGSLPVPPRPTHPKRRQAVPPAPTSVPPPLRVLDSTPAPSPSSAPPRPRHVAPAPSAAAGMEELGALLAQAIVRGMATANNPTTGPTDDKSRPSQVQASPALERGLSLSCLFGTPLHSQQPPLTLSSPLAALPQNGPQRPHQPLVDPNLANAACHGWDSILQALLRDLPETGC
eukprot:EG_transcript_7570